MYYSYIGLLDDQMYFSSKRLISAVRWTILEFSNSFFKGGAMVQIIKVASHIRSEIQFN